MDSSSVYHVPVLLNESVNALDVKPDGVYVDVTFGGGGHSREILSRLGDAGRLYSFDQDADAEANIIDDERFTFVRGNFRYLKNFMRYYGEESVDGILADLGVSWHHFDVSERGFSFRFDSKLDMRMNQQSSTTAYDVINDYDEKRLSEVFCLYGELSNGRKLAHEIVKAREQSAICTTGDLVGLMRPFMPREREKKEMTKVFQALRIEVNHEMEALRLMLEQAMNLLRKGGRLSVITYHSLEDRMVKNMMKTGNVNGVLEKDFYGNVVSPLRPTGNKPIVPTEEEQSKNPRSRSAKLRVAEKIA